MTRYRFRVRLALVLLLMVLPSPALSQEDQADTDDVPTVRMARATWDTGWFQAEIYRILLNRLGYRVEGPTTMENAQFYDAVAAGDTDLWVNGWFPLHAALLDDTDPVELVGFQVQEGALQGYFVDTATADEHEITNLGDLADPELASLFDADGDGLADLIGCNVEWTCAATVDHHLGEYGLTSTVEHVQGDYSPLMGETVDRYERGEPVLFYTFTPNWTVGELVPGEDVVWLETPFPSLPADQGEAEGRTEVAGVVGCAADPCQTGWPPNDIRAVANTEFLEANPSVRTLLELVVIPLGDILEQNAAMVDGAGDPADIEAAAHAWVTENGAQVDEWLTQADPNAVAFEATAGGGAGDSEPLRLAARTLPPFVIYDNRTYSGFEIELARLIADRLERPLVVYAVDTVAKQVDDVSRGVADLAIGGVAITSAREESIDFSLPVLDSGLTVLVASDADQGLWRRIQGFFRAIASSDLPWLLAVTAVAILVAAHLVWFFERRNNPDFAEGYTSGIWDSFYWSVVTMSTVGYGDKVARGRGGRILALVWIAIGTLVFATFTAAIASSLAVEELRGSINGPTDLPGNRVATVTGSPGQTYLTSAGIGPTLVDDITGAYDLLAADQVDAVVFDAPVLHYFAIGSGAGEVTTVGPDFENVQYGIVVADDTALHEEVNLALLGLIESGAYDSLHDQWFGAFGN